jgi:LPXTG-motif cell wall-anchored protein
VATTSNTTTTAPPSTTTTTTTVPTTTTTVPPYVGTLPNTGGSPTDGAVAAAIACTLAGLALTLAARPRRR